MQTKTTRAFRTIGEAADELSLQPHVLRFWESKFSQIRPIKRAGGRRLYRAEDIELLRGIKILLHEEKHPIKDVQKIIRIKGVNQVIQLGRSIKKAADPKPVKETILIPERLQEEPTTPKVTIDNVTPLKPVRDTIANHENVEEQPSSSTPSVPDTNKLLKILARLEGLKAEWDELEKEGVF